MFIYSQRKSLLSSFNSLYIEYNDSENNYEIGNKEYIFGIYNSQEKAKKVIENIIFYFKQGILNFTYEMPQDEEVDNLKWEIVNKTESKYNIKIKIFKVIKNNEDGFDNNVDNEVNDFTIDKDVIEIKYINANREVYPRIMVIYKERNISKNIINKNDIAAVEILNTRRKIYNINES